MVANNVNVFNTAGLYTKKWLKMVTFMLRVFYHNKKKIGVSAMAQ